jgi:hypothetical protein
MSFAEKALFKVLRPHFGILPMSAGKVNTSPSTTPLAEPDDRPLRPPLTGQAPCIYNRTELMCKNTDRGWEWALDVPEYRQWLENARKSEETARKCDHQIGEASLTNLLQ